MYKTTTPKKTSLRVRNAYPNAQTIEMKVARILNNKEPIKEPGVVTVYTERKEGVKAELNIRTDRWELALDAFDKIAADKLAKRLERQNERDQLKADGEIKGIVGGPDSVQTDGKA